MESPQIQPSKPSKPSFAGFEGFPSGDSQKIARGFVGFEGSVPASSQKIEVEKGPEPAGVPYFEWKAREMNRLFQEHALTGQPGQIKPETIQDGLERRVRRKRRR
jgi:hypothetical protein